MKASLRKHLLSTWLLLIGLVSFGFQISCAVMDSIFGVVVMGAYALLMVWGSAFWRWKVESCED